MSTHTQSINGWHDGGLNQLLEDSTFDEDENDVNFVTPAVSDAESDEEDTNRPWILMMT